MQEWLDIPICEYEQIHLHKLRVGLEQRLSEVLISPNVETTIDDINHWITLRVEGYVWSEGLQHFHTSYPVSWWDAFKVRWFPKWALRRWPAEYNDLTVDVRAVYPKLKIAYPHEECVINTAARIKGVQRDRR